MKVAMFLKTSLFRVKTKRFSGYLFHWSVWFMHGIKDNLRDEAKEVLIEGKKFLRDKF